jgi:dynein heavy chain
MMDHLLKAKILPNKEEIEDVCDSADKQVTIKKRLGELSAYWDYVEFEFQAYKGKDVLCKLGGN